METIRSTFELFGTYDTLGREYYGRPSADYGGPWHAWTKGRLWDKKGHMFSKLYFKAYYKRIIKSSPMLIF